MSPPDDASAALKSTSPFAGRPPRLPALAKYDVLEELGHGGMATVYRAHDKRLGRDVAIKVLHPHLRENAEVAHRFEAEARAVAKLRHRNIVEVFDVSSVEESDQYLVVEFVRGQTLRKVLQRFGVLPPEIAAAVGLELLSALAHAHAAGVVHRDVKPENVLLEHLSTDTCSASDRTPIVSVNAASTISRTPIDSNRGERIAVKLTDFGIAKLLDAQGVTSTGQVLGSPAHMAPEQIEGFDVDGRADVFAMGVLLYECMVGHLPFLGNNPAQVLRRVLEGIYSSAERERPTIGRAFSTILDRALARDRDHRYASAEAMREALAAELARLGFPTPRASLESYFDDPERWQTEHDASRIARLCELGSEARRKRDAVGAAADYNRALAYAPGDANLLRIVSSMHRTQSQRRLALRVVPLVGVAVTLGLSGFYVLQEVRRPIHQAEPRPNNDTHSTPPRQAPPPTPDAATEVPHNTTPPSSAPPSARTAAAPTGNGTRSIAIASLQPRFGVKLTVDGASVPDPAPGDVLSLAVDKAHTLVFTCEDREGRELCVAKTISVTPTDVATALDIQLAIRPATLLIEGETGHSYSVVEVPNLTLVAGVEAEVPMLSGSADRTVTLFDRAEPQKGRHTTLRAGQRHRVSFAGP